MDGFLDLQPVRILFFELRSFFTDMTLPTRAKGLNFKLNCHIAVGSAVSDHFLSLLYTPASKIYFVRLKCVIMS